MADSIHPPLTKVQSTTPGLASYAVTALADPKVLTVAEAFDDGEESTVMAFMNDVWEYVDVVVSSGGTVLQRGQVHWNSAGGQDKIDWPSGTKLIYVVGPPDPARRKKSNTWTAPQWFNGQELFTDIGKTSSIRSPSNGLITFKLGSVDTVEVTQGSLRLISSTAGSGSGPTLNLARTSASGNGYLLAPINWRGLTSTGVEQVYARALARIVANANGSYSGGLDFVVAAAAALATQMSIEAGKVYLPSTTALHVGKSATDATVVGHSVLPDGTLHVTKAGADAVFLRINGQTGTVRALSVRRDGTTVMQADTTASSGTWAVASDARLKQEIEPAGDVGEIIDGLQPKWFRWLIDPERVELGFFAQEVQQLLPHLVTGDPFGDPYDAPMMLDYAKFTPLLLAELQQARQRLAALEQRCTALEAQIGGGP